MTELLARDQSLSPGDHVTTDLGLSLMMVTRTTTLALLYQMWNRSPTSTAVRSIDIKLTFSPSYHKGMRIDRAELDRLQQTYKTAIANGFGSAITNFK